MAGLVPSDGTERIAPPDEPSPTPNFNDVVVEIRPGIRVTVTNGGATDENDDEEPKDPHFDDNLAETIGDGILNAIATDLLEGIDLDERSREGFVAHYTRGLDLLGLKLETTSVTRGRRNTSKIWHPLLLWAIVEFQSGARAELYPASGPCKVAIATDSDADTEDRARHLEQDINHYLTVTASEYYPDCDQGLFYLGYGGNIYKKIYRCPIRERPVSENVYLPDLIVSNDARDMLTAQRITHKMEKLDREIKQLQRLGLYRDVELTQAAPEEDIIKRKERDIAGRRQVPDRPQDTPHTIYETYTFLDLTEWDKGEKGQKPGIPIPYRVTLDKDSRTILELRRNWKEHDKHFRRRKMWVKFGLVPGMGFHDYGLLHLLGNSTRALTALWRIAIDAGMFSNFPGGIRARGSRTDTNELNPAPGEFVPVDVPDGDLKKALMPLPYKGPDAALLGLMEYIEKDATQVWGSLKFPVGEGKTNIPVGSILSMVEQQTTNMMACHKRLHAAQAEELMMLKDLFAENPEDLWKFAADPAKQWQTEEELRDLKLVPASDPNIPSQTHRIMQATALAMLQQQVGPFMQPIPVLQRILQSIGISDFQSLINYNPQPQMGNPQDATAQAKIQVAQMQNQTQLAKVSLDHQGRMAEIQAESQDRQADRDSREKIASLKAASEQRQQQMDYQAQAQQSGLEHQREIQKMNMQAQVDMSQANMQHQQAMTETNMQHQLGMHQANQQHQQKTEQMGLQHELGMQKQAGLGNGEDNGSQGQND